MKMLRTATLGVISMAMPALMMASPIQAQARQSAALTSAADLKAVGIALSTYSVSPADRAELIDDLRTGRRQWDSQSGAEPVSTETFQADSFVTHIHRFADRSVAVARIEDPSPAIGNIAPQKISNCHKRQGEPGNSTYMDNCLISWDAISWSMSFRADYRFNSGGSSIYRVSALTYGGAGDLSNPKVEVVKSPAGRKDTSRAQGSVTQKGGGFFSRTVGIRLSVTPKGGRTSSFGT